MSQVIFETEHPEYGPVEVISGWDSPLRYYHLTILRINPPEDEDELVWCNLDHFRDGLASAEEAGEVLKGLGFEPPEGWGSMVTQKLGNVLFLWQDGRWVRKSM